MLQFLGDIDELLGWFAHTEEKILQAEPMSIEPGDLRAQLQQHKALQEEIAGQKARARDITTGVKRMRRESTGDEDPIIGAKLDELKTQTDAVS